MNSATCAVLEDSLRITTFDKLPDDDETQAHPILDLVDGQSGFTDEDIAVAVRGLVPHPSEDPDVDASVTVRPGVLIVTRPPRDQEEIAGLLADMRRVAVSPHLPRRRDPAHEAIERALDALSPPLMRGATLGEFAAAIERKHGINVVLDRSSGVSPDRLVWDPWPIGMESPHTGALRGILSPAADRAGPTGPTPAWDSAARTRFRPRTFPCGRGSAHNSKTSRWRII